MAAERKLKAEIDRTLKKVIEGQEVFEDLWKQVISQWYACLGRILKSLPMWHRSMIVKMATSVRSLRVSLKKK